MENIILSLGDWTSKDFERLTEGMEFLTEAKFEALLGKKVQWLYAPNEHNHLNVYENTFVGLKEYKNKKEIKAKEGDTYIYLHDDSSCIFDEKTFTCSDSDRAVYFKVVE